MLRGMLVIKFSKLANAHSSFRIFRRWEHARPLNGLSYLNVPGQQPLLGLTLGQLLDNSAKLHGDEQAVVSSNQGIVRTFAQIKTESENLAEGFLELGLQKGDRLAIWSPNNYEWYLTKFAAAKAGLILVNINPAYEGPELLYSLNKVRATGIVMADSFRGRNYYEILNSVVPSVANKSRQNIEAPSLKTVITMSKDTLPGTVSLQDVSWKGAKLKTNRLKLLNASIQFDDVANIQFSSGTTGKPKGVVLSHHNLVNNSYLMSNRFRYTHKDRVCITVPFFHCYGGVVGILAVLHACAACVIPEPGFDANRSLEVVEEKKCTVLYGTPTMYVDMLRHVEGKNLRSLRLALTAGAICPEKLAHDIASSFGCHLANLCGSTETSPAIFQSLPGDSLQLASSTVGYPLEHTEVKVVNRQGQIVPLGEEGELCSRGYLTMLGYWDDPEKTAEAFTQSRWFHSGDIFKMTEMGYGQIVGRIKDMIIRGGENIYPKEIEEFLHMHSDIEEAHVFGISDYRLGEEVAVWVRLRHGSNLTVEELHQFCKGNIAAFKIPKYVFFRDDFPRTVSGKVQKFRMREESEKLLGKSAARGEG